jgi:hypothetical protein
MRLVKDFGLQILQQDFGNDCKIDVRHKLIDKEKLVEKINLLIATSVDLKIFK